MKHTKSQQVAGAIALAILVISMLAAIGFVVYGVITQML